MHVTSRPRIIPCLLLKGEGLYKTVKFRSPQYVGDPINVVKIFNEKEVDEIFLLDIAASKNKQGPNFGLIQEFAQECFMPVCYGGGISTFEQAKKIFDLGVEKVCLGMSFWKNPKLAEEISSVYGAQALTICVDIKKGLSGRRISCHNGVHSPRYSLLSAINLAQDYGAGEILIQDIDREGTMLGPDLELFALVSRLAKVPVVVSGGVGSLADLQEIFLKTTASAVAVGSYFVFYGQERSVLISYLENTEIHSLNQGRAL